MPQFTVTAEVTLAEIFDEIDNEELSIIRMIEFLRLPPYLGRTDPQAEDRLAFQREQARQWMRERGVEDLNDPLPLERLETEGKQ